MTPAQRVLTNKYFATVITLFFGYLLTLGGYSNVWPLFGSANQLLAAYGTDRTCCILKDDGKNRMDTLHTDVCDVSSYIYRTGTENNCSGSKYCGTQRNILSRWITADRCTSSYDIRCSGCVQLLKEIVYNNEKFGTEIKAKISIS